MTTQTDDETREYLLISHGLYWKPGGKGYTGVKELAGRYPLSDACSDAGVEAIHESEAPAYSEKCWPEIRAENESKKMAALLAERDHLQSALKESIRLQGEYAAKVEQLTAALEKIASPTQSTDLLWWQEIARTALKEQP